MSKKLNIIVFGATGYTGRLTCKYLNQLKPSTCTWGIAGRSKEKLDELVRELKNDQLPSFIVDLTKPETIDAMCKETVCLISCAGPFIRVGMPVVEACVRQQTHYIDSTGEYPFVRLVSERFHHEAKEKGIALVCSCGFDSVPSDLGNYVVHQEAKETLKEVQSLYETKIAGLSSGTMHSMLEVLSFAKEEDLSPCSLIPEGAVRPTAADTQSGMSYNSTVKKWMGPFVMAPTNERIVRRSNALSGSTASYLESMGGNFFEIASLNIKSRILKLAMVIPFTRNRIIKRFPVDVAHGPSEEKKKTSTFKCTFVGITQSGKKVVTELSSDIDAYDITGVFLSECALCACNMAKNKQIKGGVLTPAFAFGEELVKRAPEIGVKISTKFENQKE
ncbi:unnamed protein product [Phytomonas sp. Hart1]|nr:unnamed protein product [Phytomonas sp. Hart1]|eukprot:CCW68766.1 unnamed protein product [Phytomonas sp. isolate Hart1]